MYFLNTNKGFVSHPPEQLSGDIRHDGNLDAKFFNKDVRMAFPFPTPSSARKFATELATYQRRTHEGVKTGFIKWSCVLSPTL